MSASGWVRLSGRLIVATTCRGQSRRYFAWRGTATWCQEQVHDIKTSGNFDFGGRIFMRALRFPWQSLEVITGFPWGSARVFWEAYDSLVIIDSGPETLCDGEIRVDGE
ncbi:uncharacterized protein UV8b_07125 [Ustilaginoidea virens]|uniref:Uncharacterized protein n=1 Tax=Ustilaginoidea virens TaxID=1159556 RepID=A0A8E5HWI4_USTVR|nr:uncharacterized protein UV8b_07125 [Ustilaginoidea virens]QUC22884.1 hypothetical protein UV8b_07125 [Ustilaginoidea virens]